MKQTVALSDNGGNPPQPRPCAALLRRSGVDWTDVRCSVTVSSSTDAAGVVCRCQPNGACYAFVLDWEQGKQLLLRRRSNGIAILFKQANFATVPGQSYLLTLEAVGTQLRAYRDGELVFEVANSVLAKGSVGLCSCCRGWAEFSHLRVDDLHADAPVVYSFPFATSQFANFHHHLHSFPDFAFRQSLGSVSLATSAVGAIGTTPSEFEAREFERLVTGDPATPAVPGIFGRSPRVIPNRVEITRIDDGGQTRALLVDHAEPIDWTRISKLQLGRATKPLRQEVPPGEVKLSAASFNPNAPDSDTVTVLANTAVDLSDYRIQYRTYPGSPAQAVLFADDFKNTYLPRWQSVDELPDPDAPTWQAGELESPSDPSLRHKLPSAPDPPPDPAPPPPTAYARYLVAPAVTADDFRLSVKLKDVAGLGCGVVFRFQDHDNCYRLAISASTGQARLVVRSGGVETLLRKVTAAFTAGQEYEVTVGCLGSRIVVAIDGAAWPVVTNPTFASGLAGVYCRSTTEAEFRSFELAGFEWHDYHVFGAMDRLEAGKRVVVGGTPPAGPLPAGATAQPRSSATPVVQPPFWKDYVDLRLLPPNPPPATTGTGPNAVTTVAHAEPGHTRRFLRAGAFHTLIHQPKLLRKLDSNAFLLILDPQSPVTNSQPLSLELEYQRSGPGLARLSENGDGDMESAVLCFY
jgi:hypothetical protein